MNIQRLTDIQKYKLIIWTYSKISNADNVHRHHIKPKCLYPKLAKDPSNIAEVPGIVHWALHKLLLSHYKKYGNTKAVSKLKHVDLETYLNKGTIKYDFSKSDEIIQFIVQACADFAESWAEQEQPSNSLVQVLAYMSLVVYNQFGKDELDNFTDEEVIKLVCDIELADAMKNLPSIDEI